MAFIPDPNSESHVIQRHANGNPHVTVTVGTHDWNDPEAHPNGDPAIPMRVDLPQGGYDPISSAIIPRGFLPDILRMALDYPAAN
jgi:hypothetical protein